MSKNVNFCQLVEHCVTIKTSKQGRKHSKVAKQRKWQTDSELYIRCSVVIMGWQIENDETLI